ncbi:unnamed protein product [Coffea canephora]|uniref:Uncharacterized protein n=1 Tax=Coffea canephora TaxID=49390 RepID=A0A068ULD1_COFCA|nr:unnamed protein product [Coffea canephora]
MSGAGECEWTPLNAKKRKLELNTHVHNDDTEYRDCRPKQKPMIRSGGWHTLPSDQNAIPWN